MKVWWESILKRYFKGLKNENTLKIINNAGWLVGEKIFTMIIGVVVMALVARYLGPENFGIYNYALAFVTLFTALSNLGLDTLTVKSIIEKTEKEGTILFTSLVLRVIGGIVITILSSVIIRILSPNDSLVHTLVLILSFTMIFKSLEVIEYWIQAYQKSKISSLIRMASYVLSALLKVTFVLFEGELYHLTLIYMFDSLLIGLALVIAYFKKRTLVTKFKFRLQYARNILSQSWYLILSGIMITLYMQIDKIMLGSMLQNKEELGVYSAASQIATLWYFVPLAVITSFKPVIIKAKIYNEEKYLNTLQALYSIITWIGILFGVLILISSGFIVKILYGEDYINAANLVSISVWAGIFATLGSARAIWLLTENLQKYSLIQTLAGVVINIGLNYFLIPTFGGIGAATATLIAQFFANIVILSLFSKTRTSSVMIIKSISPKHIFNLRK